MEIEGHPTQDLVDELERRGSSIFEGTTQGPRDVIVDGSAENGLWVFVPKQAYDTEIDAPPPFQ
ncbi:MAG: hypothetical protein ABR507_00900 [Actinomycetota bacterium]|nr:hypothetical protein [Actinomycetota bacterium]